MAMEPRIRALGGTPQAMECSSPLAFGMDDSPTTKIPEHLFATWDTFLLMGGDDLYFEHVLLMSLSSRRRRGQHLALEVTQVLRHIPQIVELPRAND